MATTYNQLTQNTVQHGNLKSNILVKIRIWTRFFSCHKRKKQRILKLRSHTMENKVIYEHQIPGV